MSSFGIPGLLLIGGIVLIIVMVSLLAIGLFKR